MARRPAIPNLRMSSPSAPGGDLANLLNGSSHTAADDAPTAAPGGVATGAFTVRTENQPAPPPAAVSTAPSAQFDHDAKLISSRPPVYPPMAKQSNIQGNVVVDANIDSRGNVVEAKAFSGPMFLRQAAVEAVRQWKYSPALAGGRAVPTQITVTINFHLN